jgi:xylitol oxidase
LGCLSTQVVAQTFVLADGSLRPFRRGDPEFPGTVVHLGALGVVVGLTLAIEPTYAVRQFVFTDVMVDDLAAVMRAGTSVSLFTRWQSERFDQVWVKTRGAPPALPGEPAPRPLHPLSEGDPSFCTEQLGLPGPWHERLPHFRSEFTPSHGDELQSEYLMPMSAAPEAIRAMRALGSRLELHLYVSEVRAIAPDDLWLSPFKGGPSIGIHFTWRPHAEVLPLVAMLEDRLLPLGARPHWGKLSRVAAGNLYTDAPRFRALRQTLDPTGKFLNASLRHHALF